MSSLSGLRDQILANLSYIHPKESFQIIIVTSNASSAGNIAACTAEVVLVENGRQTIIALPLSEVDRSAFTIEDAYTKLLFVTGRVIENQKNLSKHGYDRATTQKYFMSSRSLGRGDKTEHQGSIRMGEAVVNDLPKASKGFSHTAFDLPNTQSEAHHTESANLDWDRGSSLHVKRTDQTADKRWDTFTGSLEATHPSHETTSRSYPINLLSHSPEIQSPPKNIEQSQTSLAYPLAGQQPAATHSPPYSNTEYGRDFCKYDYHILPLVDTSKSFHCHPHISELQPAAQGLTSSSENLRGCGYPSKPKSMYVPTLNQGDLLGWEHHKNPDSTYDLASDLAPVTRGTTRADGLATSSTHIDRWDGPETVRKPGSPEAGEWESSTPLFAFSEWGNVKQELHCIEDRPKPGTSTTPEQGDQKSATNEDHDNFDLINPPEATKVQVESLQGASNPMHELDTFTLHVISTEQRSRTQGISPQLTPKDECAGGQWNVKDHYENNCVNSGWLSDAEPTELKEQHCTTDFPRESLSLDSRPLEPQPRTLAFDVYGLWEAEPKK